MALFSECVSITHGQSIGICCFDSSDLSQAQDYTVVPLFANQTDRFKIPEGENWFQLTNDDDDETMGVNFRPFIEAT